MTENVQQREQELNVNLENRCVSNASVINLVSFKTKPKDQETIWNNN